ncbi:hypothetical protein Bbelb_204580 [Branchiostoma belcheri]|nr:hypothetical protein Bbelb_204580 [Branchiostoma belcheri]
METLLWWLCVVTAVHLTGPCRAAHVVRDTAYGQVRGNVTAAAGGKQVQVYLGVPYARGPVGDRRFKQDRSLFPALYSINIPPSPRQRILLFPTPARVRNAAAASCNRRRDRCSRAHRLDGADAGDVSQPAPCQLSLCILNALQRCSQLRTEKCGNTRVKILPTEPKPPPETCSYY